jgi:hypothetical protein
MHLLTARDKARLDRLARDVAEYRRLASEADTPRLRQDYEQCIRDKQAEARLHRTYPFSIWIFGMSVIVSLLPWALLARGGYTPAGLAASALTTVIVIALNVWRRRRSRVTAQ